jgi:3-oxoacyl-(acyl-carrier-protein) synthase/malonyl CoA-acyl carrier protein transacylase/phosphopantetheinyl transferase
MEPIAVVGMAVLLPGAPDLDTYWRNLREGVDAISVAPADRWAPELYRPDARDSDPEAIYCRRGGFVDEFAEIDAASFGIMPTSVEGTEPDQLIALRVAAAAIADSGGEARLPDRDRVGVVLGRGGYLTPGVARLNQRVRTVHQLVRTLGELVPDLGAAQLDRVRSAFAAQLGPSRPEAAIGLVPNLAASRIANRLDLRGPAYTVDAACASSLIAVDQAIAELANRRCDLMLAGGVHHCHDVTLWSVFAQLGALSPSERSRPFDRDADGILIGEGTGMIVLKRLADALRDDDRVYAVIRGTGVSSDGRGASLMVPDPGGQVRAIRQAWQRAELDPTEPDALGLLEAHGTATPAGDAAELATLAEVFGPGERAVIGSVKSMIGHTMPAAGIASLIKAALAVHHGVLPPTLHCDDPHPRVADTRFRPIDTAEDWPGAGPRRAGVNAFGFGGVNAHVLLEAAPGRPAHVAVAEPEQVLLLGADRPADLLALLDAGDPTVRRLPTMDGPSRLAVVDPTPKRLALARRAVASGRSWRGRNDVWWYPAPLGGKIAFVFPGLEAEFAPAGIADVPIGDIGRHGLGVVRLGMLLDANLRRLGLVPDGVAGHSVGEWTAMITSGIYRQEAIDEFLAAFDPDALHVPELAFAAIGTSADRVRAALGDHPEVVLSHDNAPNQSMVCGPPDRVEAFVRALRAQRVMCQVLPFQSGFHTPMLAPYLDPIRRTAAEFDLRAPRLPIWSATTVSPYPADPDAVRELFVRHLLEPVRFRALIEAMYADGYRVFVQAGVGRLTSLIGDTLHESDHLAVAASSDQRDGPAQLHRVAAALWAAGRDRRKQARSVRLNLGGGAPINLDAPTRDELRALVGAGKKSALDSLAARSPVAAELRSLITETEDAVASLLTARHAESVLHVSTETMPYLLDHCFFKQRADWPDDADRWPVVPATTVIEHLMGFAERTVPDSVAIAVDDVVLNRWIAAIPAVDIPVAVQSESAQAVRVRLGHYAGATITLARTYPAAGEPWPIPAGERVPDQTGPQLYTERWMFHGPRFQGVTELTGIGERHVRAVLTTPPAPGALLDNVGQVFGYWVMATLPERTVVFPMHLGTIRFHGPHPAPGTRVDCSVRITSVTDTTVVADAQLSIDGRLWAEFGDWTDRRFDSNPDTVAVERTPERATVSRPQPGGWVLLREYWSDVASRELIMRNHLGSAERDDYERSPLRGRRHWLLGRIAAKDAVRTWLWEHGSGPLFPAEVGIGKAENGRPFVHGVPDDHLPALDISLAHTADLAVAMARPAGVGAGIDIEEVTERSPGAVFVALGDAERALFRTLTPKTLWFTRFWAAKEAAAKADGTGLDGAPRRFRVTAAHPDHIDITVDDRTRRVECTTVEHDGRTFVVAWTDNDRESR